MESFKRGSDSLVRVLKNSLLSSILIIALVVPARSGQSGASFLKIDPSARSYALGRSQVISSLGAEAVGANAANLDVLGRKYEMFSTYSNLFEGVRYLHVSGALSRSYPGSNKWVDALGFSITDLNVSGLEGRDGSGNKVGSFAYGTSVYALSASGRIMQNLSLGMTVKTLKSQIGNYGTGFNLATDFGASYDLKGFRAPAKLGLSLNNMGSAISFRNQKDPLPTSFNIGVQFLLGPAAIVVGASQLINDGITEMNTGVEYGIGPVALRVGYRGSAGNGSNPALDNQKGTSKILNALSTGIGFKIKSIKMDYAIGQESAELGMSHRLSFTMGWGKDKSIRQGRITKKRTIRSGKIRKVRLQRNRMGK